MKKQVTLIVQPNIMAAMTGTSQAEIDGRGNVTLIYEDGSRETAKLSQAELNAGRDNWFSLVGSVQSKRKV